MDAIQKIIDEGRPDEPQGAYTFVELASVYTDYCYKIGVHDGYKYALEEFENNRLKTCDNQTPQEAWRETEFVVPFVKEHHRTPTFSDAIEVTRKQMIEKGCKIYCDNLCERSRCGMCYHKYDHKAQVKNDFKYSECETLKMFRKDMED